MKRQNAASHDYDLAQLPHTRKEVFFDISRLYFGSLLRAGLLLLVFAAPLLIVGFLRDDNELAYLAALQEAGDADRIGLYRELQIADSLLSLLNVLSWAVFSVGLAGIARMIRQYAWEEPVNLKLDFPKGIRQNWGAYMLLGILSGGWIFLSRYRFQSALYAQDGAVLNLLPLLAGLLLLLPVLGFALVNIAVYSNPFGQNLRMSIFLFLKKPLSSIGICLLSVLLPLLADVIPSLSVRLLVRIMETVLLPFLLLIWFLRCFQQLDAFVNPKHYPELVGKGLVRETEDIEK